MAFDTLMKADACSPGPIAQRPASGEAGRCCLVYPWMLTHTMHAALVIVKTIRQMHRRVISVLTLRLPVGVFTWSPSANAGARRMPANQEASSPYLEMSPQHEP